MRTTAGCTAPQWTGTAPTAATSWARSRPRSGTACAGSPPRGARRARRTPTAPASRSWTGNDHVYGLLRTFAGERLLVFANFTAEEQWVDRGILDEHGMAPSASATAPDGRPLRTDDEHLILAPYAFLWMGG